MPTLLWYGAPAIPFITWGIVCWVFRRCMKDRLTEAEIDRNNRRSIILALAGFSFTGLLAIAVVDATTRQNLQLSVYYLMVSFLSFFFALNLQSYKFHRWHDQFGNALFESATLSLLLSVAAVALSTYPGTLYSIGITTLALAVWALDHVIRLRLMWLYFRALSIARKPQPRKETSHA